MDELPLYLLQPVDGVLIPGGPQLATVVQPRLNKTSEKDEHHLSVPSSKCAEDPTTHTTGRGNSHLYLGTEGHVSTYPNTQVSQALLLLYWTSTWSQIENVRSCISIMLES